jgi:antitoxin (DNA-binding transcriptional repressor) of toxin-antitoxin stability system
MENTVALKDLRLNMEKYTNEVASGKSFIVIKQSKPIFRITPINSDDADNGRWEEVINFTKIKKGGVDIDELLAAL